LRKIYLETYGCASNLQDARIMMGLLERAGYAIVDDPSQADLHLINTCSVKTPTEHRMIQRIRSLKGGGKPLVVAGCMAKAEPDIVARFAPKASLLSPNALTRVVEAVEASLRGERVVFLEDDGAEKPLLPHVKLNDVIEIVEISSGCLSHCTFCQTKLARGVLRSYRPSLIVEAVRRAVSGGFREVWLTSQDCSAYGRDIGVDLPSLLASILRGVDGRYFVRVGMMNPLHLRKVELEQLVDIYSDRRIFKFLHLCVQSGSDRVLKSMRRGYTVSDFIRYVEAFRRRYPLLTLMTDVIVGYPSEREEDFDETCRLIERVQPDFVNISRFYPRPHTEAAKLEPLPPATVNRRSKDLTILCDELSLRRSELWLGWSGEVLIDEIGPRGEAIGRNFAYRPIVFPDVQDGRLLGCIVQAEIVGARKHCSVGRIESIIH